MYIYWRFHWFREGMLNYIKRLQTEFCSSERNLRPGQGYMYLSIFLPEIIEKMQLFHKDDEF